MKSILLALLGFGFVSAHADTYTQEQVYKLFAQQFARECDLDRAKDMQMNGSANVVEGKTNYQIFTFVCNVAAYNISSVTYVASTDSAPKVATFAVPQYEYNEQTKKLVVTGISATQIIPYGDFDAKTLSISTFHKGRGVGDAFVAGTYRFVNGEFLLKKYDVDATYDGKINPVTVINYK